MTTADKLEIAELFARLSSLLDERRFDEAYTVYHQDVRIHSPRGELAGIAEVTENLKKSQVEGEMHQHLHGDVLVEVDGDRARAGANQLVQFFHAGEPPHRSAGLRSTSTAVRTPEGWRFDEMTITPNWIRHH